MKKILSLVVCLMLLLMTAAMAEQTATEVIMGAAGKTYDSVRGAMALEAQADVSLQGGGMSMTIPVNVNGTFEYAAKIGHVAVDFSMNLMGQATEGSYEAYIDISDESAVKLYVSDDGGDTWTRQEGSPEEVGVSAETVDIPEEQAAKINEAAKVEADGDMIRVSIPLSCLIEMAQEQGADAAVSGMAGDYMDLVNQILDALKDVNLVVVTDKDGAFNGLHINDVDAAVSTVVEGMPVDAKLKMDVDIDVLDINSDAISVEIPQDVIDNAADAALTPEVAIDDIEGDAIVGTRGNRLEAVSESDELDLGSMPADALGALNGVNFTKGATGYSVFAEDGWTPEYEGEFNFLLLVNEKYDKYFNCSVFPFPFADKVTVDMLRETGVGGYDMSVNKLENAAPAMTWCGMTWGAKLADIEAAYGTPNYTNDNGGRATRVYTIDKDKDWDIAFSFTDGLLTGVKLRCDK